MFASDCVASSPTDDGLRLELVIIPPKATGNKMPLLLLSIIIMSSLLEHYVIPQPTEGRRVGVSVLALPAMY